MCAPFIPIPKLPYSHALSTLVITHLHISPHHQNLHHTPRSPPKKKKKFKLKKVKITSLLHTLELQVP